MGLLLSAQIGLAQTSPSCAAGVRTVHEWTGELGPGAPAAPSSAEEPFSLSSDCRYGELRVRIDWSSQVDDLDLELKDPSGASFTSANFQVEGPSEALSVANAAPGLYTAIVTGFLNAPTSFQGLAEVDVLGPADGGGTGGGADENGGGAVSGDDGAPRVVVAVIDSAINPYHEFFYEQPVRVTEALLEAFEVPPSQRVQLTRTGDPAADIAADMDFWSKVQRGKNYYFIGTNLIARSEAGTAFAPLLPVAEKSPHGVGVSSAVLTANPDAIILFVETEGDLGNDAAQSYAFQHPEVDLINTSYGFQVPLIGVPLPLPLTYNFSFEGVVEQGKLHFSAAGNGIGITALDPGAGAWWGIGVSGFEEYSSEGDTAVLSSNVADFVADFTQELPYCMVCQSGTEPFVAGTSFSSPQAAGVTSRVILEARRLVKHAGGIRTDGETPLMIQGAGFEISNWFVRRAMEQAARIPSPLDYDPVDGVFDLGGVPVNPLAPWLQIGWGDLSYNPEYGVVDAALAHLNLKPASFARSKSADYCEFQSGVMDFRFQYWNAIDGISVDENPIVYCESALGLRESNDPGGNPQDADGDGTVDALDACPEDPDNACATNAAPVATSGTATVAHDTPTEITLAASDDDGDSLTYSIVSGPTNGSLGAVSGNKVTYTPNAGYSGSDSFSFKANDGTADSNVATVSLTVQAKDTGGGEPNNGTLDAELSVSTMSGSLTVTFDASASRYEENEDPIHTPVEYNFVFGDGQESGFQSSAEVSHTYTAAGQYTAYVIVKDGHGQSAVSEEVPFELQSIINVGPNGGENQSRFTVDNASGPAPLQVTFDASPSVTAQGWEITGYAWDFSFEEDDGFQAQASGKVVTHVYTEPGSYTPRLLVTYRKTGTTETETKSASAVVKATAPGSTPPPANPPANPPSNPPPPQAIQSRGGGSMGWLLLGPLMIVGLARRRRLDRSCRRLLSGPTGRSATSADQPRFEEATAMRHLLAACITLVAALYPFGMISAATSAVMKPDLIKAMAEHDQETPFGAIVHFNKASIEQRSAILARHGLTLSRDWTRHTDAVFATGPVAAFESVATDPGVYYIEQNRELRYSDDTDTWATNVRVLHESVGGGPYTLDGKAINGEGVIVAIVDSGINGKHADFGDRIVANYHILCATPGLSSTTTGKCFANDVLGPIVPNDVVVVPIPNDQNSDLTGGHGTHVAGITAGDGTESTGPYADGVAPGVRGTYTGVAPGASLIGYGAGEALLILTAAEAFIHILDHYDEFPVKVINNSWGDAPNDAAGQPNGPAYDPNDAISQLVKQLVNRGVVLTFASGNSGNGNTENDRTSSYCKDPTPGVICVANYDDAGRGTQSGNLNPSSSHGRLGNHPTYPDIAAPGTNITAPCIQPEPGQSVCATGVETDWQPWYGTITGTSMAAPHVAGAVALMLQVDPTLTPGEVELLLQRTARKVPTNGKYENDPQQAGQSGTHNWGFGAGLLDVQAALDELIASGHPSLVAGDAAPQGELQVVTDASGDPLVDAPAADIIGLRMEETTLDGVAGLRYALEVAALDDLGGSASVGLRVEQLISGTPVVIGFVLTEAGIATEAVSPTSPVTTQALDVAAVDGTTLSFFVPYRAIGGAKPGDVVHNLRVTSTLDNGNGAQAGDFAPSPDGLPPALAERSPMFGVPYPVRASVAPQPIMPGPGVTQVDRFEGQSGTTVVVGCLGCPNGEDGFGVHRFSYELPEASDYEALAFVLAWQDPAIYRMTVNGPNGFSQSVGSSFLLPETDGDPVAVDQYSIRIEDPSPGTYEILVQESASIGNPFSVSVVTECPDSGCGLAGANQPPVATNGTATVAHDTPTEITLAASDDDGDSLTYSIVSGPTNGSLGAVSGNKVTYTPNAGYSGSDSFSFKANDGTADSNVATVSLTVQAKDTGGGEPNNGTLDAELSVSTMSGSLTVTFDASASRYEENEDPIHTPVEYNFVFGDGQESGFQSSAEVSHTYTAAGQYTAYVIVKDGHGQSAVSEEVPFELQSIINVGPNGGENQSRFTVDNASGPAPLQVTFDASPSVTAQGWEITGYAWDFSFEEDDGFQAQASGKVVTHVYTEPGSYTPRLLVTYRKTGTTETETKSASAVVKATAPGSTPPPANPPANPPSNPPPPQAIQSRGGGSMGWLLLGPLMLLGLIRRKPGARQRPRDQASG
jgi:subtilisin family serine protease